MALVASPVAIPFSHKVHAPLKMECHDCHITVEIGDKASFPAAGQCMVCHRAVKKDNPEIRRLAALAKDAKPFPSHRVYSVPDFVMFSHAGHRKAGIDCRACHGAVSEHDTITLEVPATMKACVACHKARQAPMACNACHELGQ